MGPFVGKTSDVAVAHKTHSSMIVTPVENKDLLVLMGSVSHSL